VASKPRALNLPVQLTLCPAAYAALRGTAPLIVWLSFHSEIQPRMDTNDREWVREFGFHWCPLAFIGGWGIGIALGIESTWDLVTRSSTFAASTSIVLLLCNPRWPEESERIGQERREV